MRLFTSLPVAIAALALLAGPAHAKELTAARACDDDGCNTIKGAAALRGMDGGTTTSAPEKGAPFYRVHTTVKVTGEKDFHNTFVYVPSTGVLRFPGQYDAYEWLAATPRGRRAFDRLVRGLEPLPAAKLRGVGAEAPTAQVDEVVPAPVVDDGDGGGFPWALLLIPGGLVLAGAGWRVTKSRRGGTARAWTSRPGARFPT